MSTGREAGTPHAAGSWRRVAVAMFAVGWDANQFSPLLVRYRHDLGLSAGVLAGCSPSTPRP